MLNIMERKKIWFVLSALLIIPGIISLSVWKLNLGIDFKGGSLAEYQGAGDSSKTKEAITAIYTNQDLKEIQVQTDMRSETDIRFFVRSLTITEDKHREIVRRLSEINPPIKELSFESIDPQVGAEVTKRAILAIGIASLVIIMYIALSFRGVPKPTSSWQFGVIAVVALLHDVVFIIGFYSFMGHFFGWEVNSEFVTAALTVMGFSVHDTIVVFDRLRENLRVYPSATFTQVANISVTQTIARSLNTSLTVILVLLAVILLGGTNIRPFSLTLLIGIVVGTYSSIFVATPLLDWWQSRLKLQLPFRTKTKTV